MSADITHGDTKLIFAPGEKIEIIAAGFRAREADRGEIEAFELRHLLGIQRDLDPQSGLNFLLDFNLFQSLGGIAECQDGTDGFSCVPDWYDRVLHG